MMDCNTTSEEVNGDNPYMRLFSPPGSTRRASLPDSKRMFRPAGSVEVITIQNLDVENNGGWKMSYHFEDDLYRYIRK